MGVDKLQKEERGYRAPPKDVHFMYPEGGELHGRIPVNGEIYLDRDYGDWVYRKCVQLVVFDDGEKMLRFTYYRKPKDGKWVFAGQTALLVEVEVIQELLKEAIVRKWINL
ncbi:hypothetical protein MUP05_03665 [Candidatus Bathyarchaeota archaeon]|nr:hypothetical protein [Candidatus Bathyarchaeota archaeon]